MASAFKTTFGIPIFLSPPFFRHENVKKTVGPDRCIGFFLIFAVAYSFSWCGDDARKRPKFDDITDSFAVGIRALVGLLGTALGSFYIV